MLCLVTDNFDLVVPVGEFSPRQVPGVITDAPSWKLISGINVIVGHSGTGKTRILEAMKKPFDGFTTDCVKREVPDNLSNGQKIFFTLEALLQIQPHNTAVLIDDAMAMLDEKHLKLLWSYLKQHGQQVVMTMGAFSWERSAALIDMPVKLFRLELSPR